MHSNMLKCAVARDGTHSFENGVAYALVRILPLLEHVAAVAGGFQHLQVLHCLRRFKTENNERKYAENGVVIKVVRAAEQDGDELLAQVRAAVKEQHAGLGALRDRILDQNGIRCDGLHVDCKGNGELYCKHNLRFHIMLK